MGSVDSMSLYAVVKYKAECRTLLMIFALRKKKYFQIDSSFDTVKKIFEIHLKFFDSHFFLQTFINVGNRELKK